MPHKLLRVIIRQPIDPERLASFGELEAVKGIELSYGHISVHAARLLAAFQS